MPHYNGGAYVHKAVQSVLDQSYAHLELIIADDCSTDGSYERLAEIKDPRVTLVRQETNRGGGAALNKAMSLAKGQYIACMDADDIACNNRLQKQVDFLEKNPDYGMVGCHYNKIDRNDRKIKSVTIPVTDTEIRYRMIFNYPFCHPSVMYRAAILRNHNIAYNPSSRFAEDYEVAFAVASRAKLYNLTDNLMKFRKHTASVTKKNSAKNNLAKSEFIRKFHPHLLTDSFIQSDDYSKLVNIFFLEDFSIIRSDPRDFFRMMFSCADSFITRTSASEKHVIYRETLDMILRYFLIKAKGYKNISGVKSLITHPYVLRYAPNFICHQLRRLCGF